MVRSDIELCRGFVLLYLYYKYHFDDPNRPYRLSAIFNDSDGNADIIDKIIPAISYLHGVDRIVILRKEETWIKIDTPALINSAGIDFFERNRDYSQIKELRSLKDSELDKIVTRIDQESSDDLITKLIAEFLIRNPSMIILIMNIIWKV